MPADLGLPWWAWSLVANMGIAVVEYLNRTGGFENFTQALPYTIWPIAAAQMGLLYAFKGAPSFMAAWAMFTVCNSAFRVINARYFVQESLTVWAYVGVLIVLLGGYVVSFHGKGA